ncbi:MAG TPA: TldD/PmbA family protein [Acidimicrobiales bacterium]|nr:TldD/PmbA family protein [Acidimicrobiales bacterium]
MSSGRRATPLPELCEQVLDLVGDRAEAEVAATVGRSALTRFANSAIHQNVAEDHLFVRLRLVADGRLAASTTTRPGPDGLRGLVERTLDVAAVRPPDPGWPGLAPPAAVAEIDRYDADTARASADRRADVVAAFVGADLGLAGAGYCDTSGYEVAFANSAGQRAAGRVSKAAVDAIHRTATSDGLGWQAAARLADLDGAAAGRVAAAKARAGADPADLAPGRYEVVLEPAAVADVVGFLLGGFSGRTHAEGRSFVRLGEAQLDPRITLRDDVCAPGTFGLPFDAEGTPKQAVDVVVDGVSAGLYHDRRSAREAGVASTGHAVVGGESFGPMASNAVLSAGDRSLKELIGSVDRGLLVSDLWYTRVLDPKTQVVTGLTRNGTFLVEGGEIVGGVRNLRFTQSYVEALGPGRVLGVGSDARVRESGYVVPSLHLASWQFTG